MLERPLTPLRSNTLEPAGIGGEAIDRLVDGIKPDTDVMLAIRRHHRQVHCHRNAEPADLDDNA